MGLQSVVNTVLGIFTSTTSGFDIEQQGDEFVISVDVSDYVDTQGFEASAEIDEGVVEVRVYPED